MAHTYMLATVPLVRHIQDGHHNLTDFPTLRLASLLPWHSLHARLLHEHCKLFHVYCIHCGHNAEISFFLMKLYYICLIFRVSLKLQQNLLVSTVFALSFLMHTYSSPKCVCLFVFVFVCVCVCVCVSIYRVLKWWHHNLLLFLKLWVLFDRLEQLIWKTVHSK